MEQQYLNQYVDTLFTNMESFTEKDGLIGKAVVQGDKTFLPVMSITIGYGGGDTHSKGKSNTTSSSAASGGMGMGGGAMGLGAKLSTDAVIVIDKENIMLAPIGGLQGNISQMIEKIPQIVSNMSAQQPGANQQAQQAQSQQAQSWNA